MRTVARAAPLLALLVFVAGLSLRPMAESDLFFRIKAGDEILARHGLPGRNLFSFTYPDYPDLDASWLFEVAVAGLYRHGGFPGIVIAKTALLLATFAAAYWLCRRRGAGPLASVLALAAAALVARERFVERPHLASLLGVVGVLAAVDALFARTSRRALAGLLTGVFLGTSLWANLHAGVFVAPLLLAAAAGGAWLDRRRGGEGRAGPLALAALAAAAATLATPIGVGLLSYLRLHLVLPALHPVDEFRSPTLTSDAAFVVFVPVAGAAVALAWLRAGARPAMRWLAPVLPLALLACKAVRFAPDLALAVAPLTAVALTALAGRLPAPAVSGPLPAVATCALLLGLTIVPRATGRVPAGIGLDARELPLSAIGFVDQHGLRDRMYNDFEIGSYLLFAPGGYPKHRVFVDPRLPAYPPELHRLLGRDDVTRDEWSAAMDRYGVETALLAYAGVNRRVAWWDPERWALVFRADDARVFVRRLPRYRALIAAREIPATFAFSFYEGTATVPLDAPPARSPVAACEWQRRLGDLLFELDGARTPPPPEALAAYARALAAPPGCLVAADEAHLAAWMGALALANGTMADALALTDRALARGDRELSTYTNRAVALEALGRLTAAISAWDDVIARAGESHLAAKAREHRARLGQGQR